MRGLNGDIALLDAVEHAVELVKQNADFVLASLSGADGIVFMRGDGGCDRCQLLDRPGNNALQAAKPRGCNSQGGQEHDENDQHESQEAGGKSPQVPINVNT